MPIFIFEIVQKVDGQPVPNFYQEWLAHSEEYKGSSRIVYWEFPDESKARSICVGGTNEFKSFLRDTYVEPDAGLDVFFIRQLLPDEELTAREMMARVLFHHKFKDVLTPEIFHKITGFPLSKEQISEPTLWERNLFLKQISMAVERLEKV